MGGHAGLCRREVEGRALQRAVRRSAFQRGCRIARRIPPSGPGGPSQRRCSRRHVRGTFDGPQGLTGTRGRPSARARSAGGQKMKRRHHGWHRLFVQTERSPGLSTR
ncbi:Hypothetical protein CAP_7222 [Chondromyces apiculatus DSM 436]|uniref:Uncharacterized protein n=1 Tax=Chondromyces apiculatus DSM 436 TaxID=1192034 RepID=A0A017SZ88_9BACT|nr:Hypothetical protein CAP_7222 [Chondromyces apiculatus DSM 436]